MQRSRHQNLAKSSIGVVQSDPLTQTKPATLPKTIQMRQGALKITYPKVWLYIFMRCKCEERRLQLPSRSPSHTYRKRPPPHPSLRLPPPPLLSNTHQNSFPETSKYLGYFLSGWDGGVIHSEQFCIIIW
ncbi:hypothetical protein JTE90_028065 [Oedothorax gibbosus]|uniref:Uncharacterized protein n=1 Tax=Oedothorax gibbosus TaxID=931172 RepID=A0AAV6VBA5_9ARAC|nr:hypothetical protein JTE90_028065 [Oedothorax gibbosus]